MEKIKLWNKNFIIVIVINFLVFLNHLMVLSTFPFFVRELGYSDSVSGACATLFSVVAVFFRPFVGKILDCGKRKSVLLVGLCGMALMPIGYLVVYTFAASVFLAVIMRVVHGISLACSNTSTSTVATDVIPKPRFAEGMGIFGMATALATACAPAIGEFLMNKGFGLLYIVSCGIMLFSLLLLALLKTPKLKIEKQPFSFKDLIDKNALPASAVALVFLLTYGALENYTLKFASDCSDITVSGGLYFTVMAIMLLITRFSVGKVADKKGEAVFVYTCNASMFVALLALALFPNNAGFIVSAVLSGYAFGGIEPSLQAMAVNIAPANKRGAANSTFLCAYDIGIGIGGGLAGVMIDYVGYEKMFAVISFANILSVVLYFLFGRKHPSSLTYKIKQSKM